jgi:two-component system chemotaxis sensor kinase CheA
MADPRRARYIALFAAESRSLLSGGRRTLATWREHTTETAPGEELFRVLHTIKGMAASLGFESLVAEVHDAESDLATVRLGERVADVRWLDGLERRLDHLAVGCEAIVVREGDVEAAAGAASGAGVTRAVVQVDLSRLDALLDDLGALVTARQELERHAAIDTLSPMARSAVAMSRRLDALQERIVHVRLAPLGEVLERIAPQVRELARTLGKEVTVEVAGESLEVDRGILDVLPEPLLHLVRNAVDHGLEAPAARRLAGKPPAGTIRIRARQDRDAVVIELADDGRGIDRMAIARSARAKGMLEEGVELGDDGILAILARPGFSTASEVTDVSGRGVGLDVVLSRLHAVGAAVTLTTVAGRGTTISVRLPTRLGILPALVTLVGEDRYVMPLTHVSELVAWDEEAVRVEGGRMFLEVRGESVPVVDLRRLLQYRGGTPPPRRPAVIVDAGGQRVALLTDQIHGQVDAVIQQIERPVGLPRWITGATVLGDGQPALLLDLASVV